VPVALLGRLVSELHYEFIWWQSIPDLGFFIVTLGRNVEEDKVWLLNECSLKFNPVGCLKVKLFRLLCLDNFLSLFLLHDLFTLSYIKLLNEGSFTIWAFWPSLEFEIRFIIFFIIALETNSIGKVRLIVTISGISIFAFLVNTEETLTLDGCFVTFVVIIAGRNGFRRCRVLVINLLVLSILVVINGHHKVLLGLSLDSLVDNSHVSLISGPVVLTTLVFLIILLIAGCWGFGVFGQASVSFAFVCVFLNSWHLKVLVLLFSFLFHL